MKKTYIHCIISLIILIIGFLCILCNLLAPTLSPSTENLLALCAICFIFIGLLAFAVHHRKYTVMKALEDNDIPTITRFTFMPHTSSLIIKTIKEHRHNALCTLFLTFILVLIFSCTFISTYFPAVSYLGPLVSFLFLLIGFLITNAYFNTLSNSPVDIIFGDDTIYFLDDIYTLQKSIYFLDNVLIATEGEPTLQFIYGQIEYDDSPYFILEIPIPDSQLTMAQVLRKHYLEEIKNLNY